MTDNNERIVSGKIKVIENENVISANFRKRNLVVSTEEQYPQHILIEFTQDKCNLLNHYNKGDTVRVSINIRGREWINPEGKKLYFNSIHGWRIEKIADGYKVPANDGSGHLQHNFNFPDPKDVFDKPTANKAFKEEEYDDLPF